MWSRPWTIMRKGTGGDSGVSPDKLDTVAGKNVDRCPGGAYSVPPYAQRLCSVLKPNEDVYVEPD